MKGRVAYPDRGNLRHVARQCLCDQARWVGEVGEQRAGRQFAHIARHLQDHRDGAQRLGHAADAGGFLAHEPVAQAQILVGFARLHATHAQLCGYIACAAHSGALVPAELYFEGIALGFHHALRKTADHCQAVSVNIHQAQLGDRQRFQALQKAVNEFRCVSGTATDDSNFHSGGGAGRWLGGAVSGVDARRTALPCCTQLGLSKAHFRHSHFTRPLWLPGCGRTVRQCWQVLPLDERHEEKHKYFCTHAMHCGSNGGWRTICAVRSTL